MAKSDRLSHGDIQSRLRRSGHAICVSMTSLELSYATSSSWRGSNRAVTTNFLDARVRHMKIGAAPNYVTFIGCW